MGKQEDIWYAVNVTKVVHSPRQTIATFGATTIRYYLLSELMDDVNKVRLRTGSVYSERPQIMTPAHIISQLLDGFGDKAHEYAEWLEEHGEIVRILKYGLHFRKEKTSEELMTGSIDEIADNMRSRALEDEDDFAAVVIGADELWEVSLLKFVVDYIQRSASINIQELAPHDSEESSKRRIREEIEADFRSATMKRQAIDDLAGKLKKYGLFEEYEDRFYGLLRGLA